MTKREAKAVEIAKRYIAPVEVGGGDLVQCLMDAMDWIAQECMVMYIYHTSVRDGLGLSSTVRKSILNAGKEEI